MNYAKIFTTVKSMQIEKSRHDSTQQVTEFKSCCMLRSHATNSFEAGREPSGPTVGDYSWDHTTRASLTHGMFWIVQHFKILNLGLMGNSETWQCGGPQPKALGKVRYWLCRHILANLSCTEWGLEKDFLPNQWEFLQVQILHKYTFHYQIPSQANHLKV